MKKFLFVMLALVSALSLRAQFRYEYAYMYNPSYWNYQYENKYDKKMVTDHHVKEMTEIYLKKNGKEQILKIYSLDMKGNMDKMMINRWMFGKKNREMTFIPKGGNFFPDYLSVNGKGKEIIKSSYVYNIDSLLTEQSKYRRGHFVVKIINTYDQKNIKESDFYRKKTDVPRKKWIYEYYADHSKKSSTLYKKGKIKYVWNYECKPEGELARKHKDTTAICKEATYDKDSNRTETYRKFRANGKPYKEVLIFNKKNQMLESAYYNHHDIIRYRFVQSPDHLSSINYTYNRKGIESYRNEKLYNSKNKLTEEAYYRRQKTIRWKTVYEYNDKDLLVSEKISFRKDRRGRETKYFYDDKDLLVAKKCYKKNGKQDYQYKYTYLYY